MEPTPVPFREIVSGDQVREIAHQLVVARWGEGEWDAFNRLGTQESNFRPNALNSSSGACGVPQALPCSKLPQGINTPVRDQLEWMVNYVQNRYGTPSNAWNFHLRMGWY